MRLSQVAADADVMPWATRNEDKLVSDVYRRAGFPPGNSSLAKNRELAIRRGIGGHPDIDMVEVGQVLRARGYDAVMRSAILKLDDRKHLLFLAHTFDMIDDGKVALHKLSPVGCYNIAMTKAEEDVRAIDGAMGMGRGR